MLIHITAGHGGELEMVKRIVTYLRKKKIHGKIVSIKPSSSCESLGVKSVFDEEIPTIGAMRRLGSIASGNSLVFYHYISNISALFFVIYLKFLCKKKIIAIFHSNLDGPGSRLKQLFFAFRKCIVINIMLLLAPRLVFVSNAQRATFEKKCFFKKRFNRNSIVFYNFLSRSYVLPDVKKNFSQLDILFIGRFSFFKGFYDLMEVSKSYTERKNIRFSAIGNPESLSPDVILKHNIHFHSSVDSKKIFSYIDQANVLILPSYTESFGLVIIEAMARGLVILASDIRSIREIVEHGRNGFLFTPGDRVAMKEAVENCIKNKKILREISKNNIRDVLRFTDKNLGDNYYDLYQNEYNRI